MSRVVNQKYLALAILVGALLFGYSNISVAADDSFKVVDSPLKIKGDSVEYFYKDMKAEGRGNISINYNGSLLMADEVDVNLKTKEAWAKGSVSLEQEEASFTGESIYVNLETGDIDVEDVSAKFAPFYRGKSAQAERVDGEYYLLKDTYVTTCDDGTDCEDGTPQYRLQASIVEYYPDDKLILRNVVLYFRQFPVAYVPVMLIPIEDIPDWPIQTEFGKNSEWGAFALTKYRYYITDDHDGNVLLDWRENQGFAVGAEHFFRNGDWGRGAGRFYYADDDCANDGEDCSRSGSHVSPEESRYRAQMRYQANPIENWGVNTEINKLSDEFIIQDFFFRDEFERITFPDNYVSAINATDDYTFGALARFRLDDFVGVTERLPEISFDTHTKPLGDTPFYFRSETKGGWLNNTFKDFDEDARNEDAMRVHNQNRLSYVFKVGDGAVTPYIGTGHTFYSRDMDGDDRDFVRNYYEAGVDASVKFFKTYDYTSNALGIEINKIRHIFTPNASYQYRSTPSHVNTSLFQFDQIDSFAHESTITLDFENKLQTKRKSDDDATETTATLLRSIVSFGIDIPQGNRSRLKDIYAQTEFSPNSWITIDSETNYDFEADEFTYANIDSWIRKDAWRFGVGHRYNNGFSSQSTIQAEWQINKDWKLGVYERFDFNKDSDDEGGRNNEFELEIERRNFFCWTVKLLYNRSHRENSFFVSFSPSAFETTAFRQQQTYRRAKYINNN